MSILIADEELTEKLDRAESPVEVCSRDGRRLGYFTPVKPAKRRLEPTITMDEADRRLNDPNAQWFSAEQVATRLKELRCSR